MDAQVFWNVIGNYNEQTKIIQAALFIFVLLGVLFIYESWHSGVCRI